MDDVTIAGMEETMLSSIRTLKIRSNEIGLKITDVKYEVILLHAISEESVMRVRPVKAFRGFIPAVKLVSREVCILLGTPFSSEIALQKEANDLDLVISHFRLIYPLQAFVLLIFLTSLSYSMFHASHLLSNIRIV